MIRILLVDDQNIVRQGIQALLEPRPKLQVVGTAEDGNSAIEEVSILMPDVVLMDLEMPGMSGIIATQKICQKFPTTKVLVLSSHENQEYVTQALQAGAQGYLLKNTLSEELEQAICSVDRGLSQIESKLLKKVVARLSTSNSAALPEQNGLISIAMQPSKLEVNTNGEERFVFDNSTEVSDFSNGCLQKNRGNIKGIKNELLPKINKTTSLKPVFKPIEPEVEKLKRNSPKQKDETSLTDYRTWLNNRLAIVPALLIMTIILISFFNYSRSQFTSTPAQPKKANILPVETVKIEPVKSYQTSQTYTGEVTASRISEVGFERGGKLVEIFVAEGDLVSAYTPLARLDTANLEAQRQGLIAQKEQEEAIFAELKNGAITEEIAAAQAQVGDLRQQLELAKLKSSRREYLYNEGAIAREQLEEITFNRKALNERLANAKSNLDKLQNGTRVEKISAQQAAVDRLTAEIEDLDITIDKSILKSPFNGIVSARNLEKGTVVEAGTSILRLVEDIQPKIEIGIPIDVASQMQPGLKQQVTIGGKKYSAVVDSILPEVDTATRTRTLVLKLTTTAPTQISPKQIARLAIVQTNNADGYWLPITALTKSDRGLWSCYALVQSPDGNNKAERRYVEILETRENRVLVRGTLRAGDEIITDGTHRLVPGQLVTNQ